MAVFSTPDVAGVRLRPATAADMPFVIALFSAAREVDRANFHDDQKTWDMLMMHQAHAQDATYRTHYPGATLDIIERPADGAPIGRLCLHDGSSEIRLMDIALMPEARNQGVGTALIRAVMAEGARRGLPVRLHVETFNPAYRLYERLGFTWLEDRGVYQFLEWRPQPAAA